MKRRIVSVAVVAVALLAAYGCGGAGSDTSVRSGATLHAADASGIRTVSYHGVQFDVPADWPVYDLAADPSTCVRFDQHAVYLGTPSPDMVCPAGLIGRADAILVEPSDDGHAADAASASASTASELVNDLQADVADGGEVTYQLNAAFPSAGVNATVTYQDSNATAQQILHSFRSAAK